MAKKSAAAQQRDAEREREAGVGDNSGVLGIAGQEQLRSLEHRIMSLLEERDELNEDIAEVFKEAKDSGFDTKILRKAIARKRAMNKDAAGFAAAEELLTLYFATLYQPDLPGFVPLNPGLADQRKAEDDFEASQEELAAQAGRPQPEEVI